MIRRNYALIAVLVLLIISAAAWVGVGFLPAEARWRVAVVGEKLKGNLGDVPFLDLLQWLKPGSPVYLELVAENPNPHASIKNRATDPEDIARGDVLYREACGQCHGIGGRGESGPDIVESVAVKSDWTFFSTAKWGRSGTSMPAQALGDADIWKVHAYLRHESLADATRAEGAANGLARPVVNVSAQDLVAAPNRPDEWLTYAGGYEGHRHSSLSQISPSNVGALTLAWVAQLPQVDRELEASPLVAGALMFVSRSREGVVALDTATGSTVWEYNRPIAGNVTSCCGMPNRGVALLADTVFVSTIDAQLVALDANTGRQRWIVPVADAREGYAMTGAPLALGDRIVVGVAGGEFGSRGFLAAFSATDGKRLWTFYTVPGPGEPGHDTWAGDSWRTGGAPTWTTGSYDAAQDLVIWGVGNPAPEFNSQIRKGDNLYSNSVIALDAKTGRLRWHYQFTPGDDHDWDSNQQPVLTEITWKGLKRQVVLWANRNAFFYAIDRVTGEFLFAEPFARQTWNDGFDAKGRPRTRADSAPSPSGTVVSPSVASAANWWPPSYDRDRGLMFINGAEAAGVFFRADDVDFRQGQLYEGGSTTPIARNQPSTAFMKAIDVQTGKTKWQTVLERESKSGWSMGGVLSTAGGVVFSSFRDIFRALDADTGVELWQTRLGARVRGSPIAFSVNGVQHVAVAGGHSVFVFKVTASAAEREASVR